MDKPFYNSKGQMVGVMKGDTFKKTVDEKKHLMKIFDAWGIDEEIIETLEGNTKVDIWDKKNNKHYKTTTESFHVRGFPKDFGHGKQVFLPRKFFDDNQEKLF